MSEKKFFCFGKNGFCDKQYGCETGKKCVYINGDGGEYREYHEQNTRLNREAWGPCKYCGKGRKDFGLDGCGDGIGIVIGESVAAIESDSWGFLVNFCPKCGRPLTEEAWEMLEKRIGGVDCEGNQGV